ncbi:hypothetical protein ACFQE1_06240 [Halobium palmae]|uniref:DUF8160 domain-containing protein n=1 Tax=Halobium palmae TaxID=1776492 RepID=A0ABD5RXK1_9EURY
MSEEEEDGSDGELANQTGALDHGSTKSEYAKHWTNRAGQDTELPPDDVDVKSEWVGTTVYLPPSLRDELNLLFQEYKYECNRHGDVDLEKLRHFYPLIVALGVERLEKTDPEDLPPLLSYIAGEYE